MNTDSTVRFVPLHALKRLFFLIGFFINCSVTIGQDATPKMLPYDQFIEEMLTCQDTIYRLSYTKIECKYAYAKRVDSMLQTAHELNYHVYVNDVEFVSTDVFSRTMDLDLNKIHFKKHVNLDNLNGLNSVRVKECTFDKRLNVRFPNTNNKVREISFEQCHFNSDYEIEQKSTSENIVYFENCTTTIKNKVAKDINILVVFAETGSLEEVVAISSPQKPKNIHISLSNQSSLRFTNCKLSGVDPESYLLFKGDFKEVIIDSTQIEMSLLFEENHIKDRLLIKASELADVSLDGVNLPSASNIHAEWSQFGQNLSIATTQKRNTNHPKAVLYEWKKIYKGLSNEEQKNAFTNNELMALYNEFFHIYKERGDTKSANACYVAMKDVQTARLKYLYNQDASLENWMYWQLNIFLKQFSDYGTNPVKSIIYSMWAILYFAIYYFFFYSSWDKINRRFLIKRHRSLLDYFSSGGSLKEFYLRSNLEEFNTYEAYRKELKDKQVKVPFFIHMFGKPLYNLSIIRHRMIAWTLKKSEIMNGKWSDLSRGRKCFVGSISGLIFCSYILYLILVRALNSVILSLNTFSTLGFGDIPVKGISRYIAVLEGLVGWFLLSIFSVSLIGQILQN